MLALYVGPSAAGLVPAAARYVRIRALCFPAQLLGNVLQAQRDTPPYARARCH